MNNYAYSLQDFGAEGLLVNTGKYIKLTMRCFILPTAGIIIDSATQ
jgi:hypothetical protein